MMNDMLVGGTPIRGAPASLELTCPTRKSNALFNQKNISSRAKNETCEWIFFCMFSFVLLEYHSHTMALSVSSLDTSEMIVPLRTACVR